MRVVSPSRQLHQAPTTVDACGLDDSNAMISAVGATGAKTWDSRPKECGVTWLSAHRRARVVSGDDRTGGPVAESAI